MDALPAFDRFTGQARRALWLAYQEAQRFEHDFLSPEHLLAGLLREGSPEVLEAFRRQGFEQDRVIATIDERLATIPPGVSDGAIELSPQTRSVLWEASARTDQVSAEQVRPTHVLMSLMAGSDPTAHTMLAGIGFDPATCLTSLQSMPAVPNRDDLVQSNKPEPSRNDPSPELLGQLFGGIPPLVGESPQEVTAPTAEVIFPVVAEMDWQILLTQMVLAVSLGGLVGFIIYRSLDGAAGVAAIMFVAAIFRNSILGMLAGAGLGYLFAEHLLIQDNLGPKIEWLLTVVFVPIGIFVGSFLGNIWRRSCPEQFKPSATHRKPPGVV